MMNPWYVIGWIILAVCAVILALAIGVVLITAIADVFRFRSTRDTPPMIGQIWKSLLGDGAAYYVTKVHDNGRVSWSSRDPRYRHGVSLSASDTAEEWRERIRQHRLHLADWWVPERDRGAS